MSDSIQSDVLAQETHSGRAWSLLILPPMILPAIALSQAPTKAILLPGILVAVIGVGVLAMTWSGFQYRFLRDRIEIRMLGFRLRSIPKQSIVSYSIEPWSFARGYGIRGIGKTRAYVWCNRVVHIHTTSGDIFLGHNDPERIVSDLDQVMGR